MTLRYMSVMTDKLVNMRWAIPIIWWRGYIYRLLKEDRIFPQPHKKAPLRSLSFWYYVTDWKSLRAVSLNIGNSSFLLIAFLTEMDSWVVTFPHRHYLFFPNSLVTLWKHVRIGSCIKSLNQAISVTASEFIYQWLWIIISVTASRFIYQWLWP